MHTGIPDQNSCYVTKLGMYALFDMLCFILLASWSITGSAFLIRFYWRYGLSINPLIPQSICQPFCFSLPRPRNVHPLAVYAVSQWRATACEFAGPRMRAACYPGRHPECAVAALEHAFVCGSVPKLAGPAWCHVYLPAFPAYMPACLRAQRDVCSVPLGQVGRSALAVASLYSCPERFSVFLCYRTAAPTDPVS